MCAVVNENNYRIVRNDDPLFQVMKRISDTNNVADVVQEYVKLGKERNDFATQLELFDKNAGILNDGKSIDLTNFFIQTKKTTINGITQVVGESIPYFKFKTNCVLKFKDKTHLKDTYINKENYESIFDLYAVDNNNNYYEIDERNHNYYIDHDRNPNTDPIFIDKFELKNDVTYKRHDDKKIVNNSYSSYPLQRVDKLVSYEMDSLFVYLNGRKIPDNEVFVYTNNSFTDVFIPEAYIPGNIRDENSNIDIKIHIDYRQPGSEALYYREIISGNKLTIDLNDPKYSYNYERVEKPITADKILLFIDGYLERVSSVVNDNNILTVNIERNLNNADVEIYIINDLVYRYKIPETSMLNSSGSKLHFYIPDDYFADIISGPITKTAIAFFYKGERIIDDSVIQTSRFSFEYQIPPFVYRPISYNTPVPGIVYYTKDSNNKYIEVGQLTKFKPGVSYFSKETTNDFDETKFDFIVEDLGTKVDELGYKIYGDDYYLLNMLGVKRCVDKMKGSLSYSIFDKAGYEVSFRDTLSNNGTLFDVPTALRKYDSISNDIGSDSKKRIKTLISERPALLRSLLEQFKIPSKKIVVVGNANDVQFSSITKFQTPVDEYYYKIYLNHILLDSTEYTVTREDEYEIIRISKDLLNPTGINVIEAFQYDLTYRNKTIFKDNLNNDFTELIDPEGETVYEKTYTFGENGFNFDSNTLDDDICAIERIEQGWFDSRHDEFYYFYPTSEKIGYRMVKEFKISNRTANTITIRIKLYKNDSLTTKGNFFLVCKQYNVVNSFLFDNSDGTYMEENDLMIPLYSKYDEEDKYIPYICNSEPLITKEGKEMIYGKDYTFITPEKNHLVTSSYLILKKQIPENSRVVVHFNSTKTNILVLGYDDLNITNRYGLIYFSELPYPVSTTYMNIFVNGEKLTDKDVDILSDKLIRVRNMSRTIRTILITTNLKYKDTEIQEFLSLYEPSEFEKTLEKIFWNCDPSKRPATSKPNIDFVYKVNPYYSEFIGEEWKTEDEYNNHNPYYKDYVNYIKDHKNEFNSSSIFSTVFTKPNKTEEDYELKLEAWENAEKFFNIYRDNHGFVEDVDSIKQAENVFEHKDKENFISDTLEIMYLNWLCKSGKTRSYGFKGENIDPRVLKHFSIYENIIIDNRMDIVVDSERFYDGLHPDINNELYEPDPNTGLKRVSYPGVDYNIKRRFFYEILLEVLKNRDNNVIQIDPNTGFSNLVKEICDNKLSNILYPEDFPLKPDANGIRFTGTDYDICNNDFRIIGNSTNDEALKAAIEAERAIRNASSNI